jgi:hypothetical protein
VTEQATPRARDRVCYYLQTHTRPAQVVRLVERIKAASPQSVVLIHHDTSGAPLDVPRLESMRGVHVIVGPGGYGNYTHLDRYFAAVDWLEAQGVEFDWLQNMTGQDYPIQPIEATHRFLAESDTDGYLEYVPVFWDRTPPDVDWGIGREFRFLSKFDTSLRFDYRHWWVGRPTRAKQRFLRPLMALDFVQPWFRISLAYSTIAVRRRSTIFNNDDFICYAGSFFCTLSAECVHYARDFAREHPEVVAFFRTMPAADEVFLHTVLVNSKRFRIVPDAKRYMDWSCTTNNHPKTLGVADLPAMLASGAHWARKFDSVADPDVLDILDRHIGHAAVGASANLR